MASLLLSADRSYGIVMVLECLNRRSTSKQSAPNFTDWFMAKLVIDNSPLTWKLGCPIELSKVNSLGTLLTSDSKRKLTHAPLVTKVET